MTKASPLKIALLVSAAVLFTIAASRYSHPQVVAHQARVRIYFVAADEILWDYAPSGQNEAMGRPFDDFQNFYMRPSAHRIGRVYKKAIYREYTDAKFQRLADRPTEEYMVFSDRC